MVYDPEPKTAGTPGVHPEAGQGETERPDQASPRGSAADDAARATRNERRKAARAAKAHQASTGVDLSYDNVDPTKAPADG